MTMPTETAEVLSDEPSFPNEEAEVTGEPETPEAEKPDNQIETLQAQKEHWRKKFQDTEKKLNSIPKEVRLPNPEADDEFKPRVEFLLTNRDINQEEYDHLAAVALRDSGKISFESLQDAKKKEMSYISFLRKGREDKTKVPGSTSPGGFSKSQKSSEEIGKMTREEHMRYEEQMVREQNQGI